MARNERSDASQRHESPLAQQKSLVVRQSVDGGAVCRLGVGHLPAWIATGNDLLQMAVLEPTLCVLDETDSGLDIDALKIVADGVNALRSPDRAMLVITHYQRLLNYIVPDKVHVMTDGKIVKTGGKELAVELEESG